MLQPCVWERRRSEPEAVSRLAAELRVPPVIAHLLWLRGLVTPEAASRFLAPRLEHLHDPMALTGMAAAVDRVLAAIARREKVAIHGDYDVDGITSTVILRRAIEMLGGNVVHFIPERIRDGYGLQVEAIERLHADGVTLVISVDCGIRSGGAADRARQLGVDLIITDHHEPDDTLPRALAVINPKRHDCAYPDKHLAGVGVALKLVQAICARQGRAHWLPSFVKVAAIGTLADVVPLVGENRVIAKIGLERLSAGPHTVGLRALLEASGLAGRTLDGYHIGFVLGPRINAAGRMGTPDIATRLLLQVGEEWSGEARRLAEQLNAENLRRREEEAAIVALARRLVETDLDVGAHNVLVVAGEGWHRGVIGIVASKLVDLFHKPAVVLSIDGDVAHGSCRSIPGFDMLGGLERCAELFDRFGGHRQAAGLTMPAGRIAEFRGRMSAHANEVLAPDDLRPRLRLDATLPLSSITPDLVSHLDRLAPFGVANPKPLFEASAAEIVSGPTRLKERHLTMTVRQDGRVFRALAWRAAEHLDFFGAHRGRVDLAYHVERNDFRGEANIELSIADARAPRADSAADAGTVESTLASSR
jgi:single-stranded-DNA-specific exonuclease